MSVKCMALRNLYQWGRVPKAGLEKAVTDGTIAAAEYQEITGEAYPA